MNRVLVTMTILSVNLCDTCRHLRPWKLLDCTERTDLRFHLGDVDDILAPDRRNNGCVFCNIIVAVLQVGKMKYGGHLRLRGNDEPIYNKRDEIPPKAPFSIHFFRNDSTVWDVGEYLGTISLIKPNPRSIASDSHKAMPPFPVYPVLERIDWSRIQTWLQRCDETHHHCFDGYSMEFTVNTEFRVIDVQERRLKRISPSDRYVALSYVWGRAVDDTRLMTRTSNFDQLHEKGSLRRLPLTVEDALKICESIGENYLWVDSICIAQDDESRKGGQIAIMDQIYASASLVLVIASCEGMHEQIRGVSVDRKLPVCERVEDLVFMEAREISAAYLYTTVWSTRGWTYQEGALARRKLILLDQEVTFSCSAGEIREYTYKNDDLQAKGDMHNQSWRLLQMDDDSSDLWTQYVGHVERYTKRSLGDEKDKLNAISGILRPLFNDHGGCLFGIPLSYLDLGLLWSCTNSSTMEKHDSASVEFSITSGFPTWSWTSVKSSVTYDMVGLRADTFAGSLVKWFYQPAPGSRLEPIPSQRHQSSSWEDELAEGQSSQTRFGYMAFAWSTGMLEVENPDGSKGKFSNFDPIETRAQKLWPHWMKEIFSEAKAQSTNNFCFKDPTGGEIPQTPSANSRNDGILWARAQCAVFKMRQSSSISDSVVSNGRSLL